jgi:hypothetical protein
MATGDDSGPIHPVPTRRSGYRYQSYKIHHGRGGRDDAQWLPTLSHDEEFAVFDTADFHEISAERRLYGVLTGPEGGVLGLGTWGQQVAEFPYARPNQSWHGYPLWPLKEAGPPNRRDEKHRPPKAVFLRMEAVNLINARDRKRLMKGDHTCPRTGWLPACKRSRLAIINIRISRSHGRARTRGGMAFVSVRRTVDFATRRRGNGCPRSLIPVRL